MGYTLTDTEARIAEGQAKVLQEIANGLVTGQQYFTADEIEGLIINHLGEETWEYRKEQGVQPIEW